MHDTCNIYMIISNVICMYYKYNLLLRSYTNEKKKLTKVIIYLFSAQPILRGLHEKN